MSGYRYVLKPPYLPCPECGRAGKFTRFYDNYLGEFVAPEVGKCFRDGCYNYTPWDYRRDHPEEYEPTPDEWAPPPETPVSYIPSDVVEAAIPTDTQHPLLSYLAALTSKEKVMEAVKRYKVGVGQNGEIMFPMIDIAGRVREIKCMRYLPNGHRDRGEHGTYTLHKSMVKSGRLKKGTAARQVFFGEHLLEDATDETSIAITESEKTAMYCSMIFPGIWLATGSCGMLKGKMEEAISLLKAAKKVVIYPDSGQYDKWLQVAETFNLPNCKVSDRCENAPRNTDIMDLLEFYHTNDNVTPIPPSSTPPPTATATPSTTPSPTIKEQTPPTQTPTQPTKTSSPEPSAQPIPTETPTPTPTEVKATIPPSLPTTKPPSQNATPSTTPPPTATAHRRREKAQLTDDDYYMLCSDRTWPFTTEDLQAVWT